MSARAAGIWLTLIVALGALLRLYRLLGWNANEAFTYHVAGQPVRSIWGIIARDDPYHPPLFPIMLHFWRYLGDGELTVRLLPVLLGLLSIWMIYRLGAYLVDHRTGVVGALILAVSPFHIWHSQEVRMYSALFFFSLVAVEALARILREDRPRHWLMYVGANVLALYADYGALLGLIAQNGAAAALMAFRQGPSMRKWLLAQVAIVVLFLPWAPALLGIVSPHGPVITSEAPPSAARISAPSALQHAVFVMATFTSAFTPQGQPLMKGIIVAVYGAVLLAGAWELRHRLQPGVLLISVALLPVVAGSILSYEIGLLRPRTAIAATAGYYLLLGVAFTAFRRRPLGWLPLGALLALNGFSLSLMYPQRAVPWPEIALRLSTEVHRDEGVVLTNPAWGRVFPLYLPATSELKFVAYAGPADFERVRAFMEARGGVHLILSEDQASHRRARQVRDYLRDRFRYVKTTPLRPGLVAEHYRRP